MADTDLAPGFVWDDQNGTPARPCLSRLRDWPLPPPQRHLPVPNSGAGLIRLVSITACLALVVTLGLCVGFAPGRASDEPPATVTVTTTRTVTRTETSMYRHHSAGYWAWRFRRRTRQLQSVKAEVKRRWSPTVDYGLRLASAVYGVSYYDLRTVARCESHFDPFARNGQYLGIFQMHWSPFGLSPFDPIASALSAAQTVKADGSWRQWQCKP